MKASNTTQIKPSAFFYSILLIHLIALSCQNQTFSTNQIHEQSLSENTLGEADTSNLESLPETPASNNQNSTPHTNEPNLSLQERAAALKKKELPALKNYFDFDEAEHYAIKTSSNDLLILQNKVQKSGDENLLMSILYSYEPQQIEDVHFLEKLELLGFTKKQISTKKLDRLNYLFSTKKHTKAYLMGCAPVFRDIIVFKKHSKIIGIAKICFQCMRHHIVGSNLNVRNFGQSGDFSRLAILLYK
ncbi:hypothetical protein [Aureispira anguillae]|uniref:Uncharacterized protein n=1 Tax=Aureispira anguillae TaxID=2864201 RepID=A0A915YEB6_9BACT|nr:hypothetical protein [Aureispira anguillae]BDS11552.1 hypothetical protein AsAng_0022660 [Aureispira anguillae]